jgi:hypothetical protein
MEQQMTNQQMAQTLGYTSLALGVAEIAAPEFLSRQLGIESRPKLLGALGAREIAAGVAILSQENKTPGLWSRVAGDAMDRVLLGLAARKSDRKAGVAVATAMVLGITGLDIMCALKASQRDALAA